VFNVIKHAKASKVAVRVQKAANRVRLVVADDGVGFSPDEPPPAGFGLFSIREQLEYLGGNLEVKSALGKGTVVTLTVPLRCEGKV
jgi:signal transduction histidine kinase